MLIGRRFTQISTSNKLSVAIKSDSSLWVWGSKSSGGEVSQDILPLSKTRKHDHVPIRIGSGFLQVVASEHSTVAIARDGTLWEWKANTFVQRERLNSHSQRPASIGNGFISVALGKKRYFGIRGDGSLWAWGSTYMGRLGNGFGHSMSPDQVEPMQLGSDFIQVATADGGDHTLAVKTDGTLWGWGSNARGQLSAQLDRRDYSTPVLIGRGYASVSVNGDHSLAIRDNGSLVGWGNTENGQLGGGASVPLRPTQVDFSAN